MLHWPPDCGISDKAGVVIFAPVEPTLVAGAVKLALFGTRSGNTVLFSGGVAALHRTVSIGY